MPPCKYFRKRTLFMPLPGRTRPYLICRLTPVFIKPLPVRTAAASEFCTLIPNPAPYTFLFPGHMVFPKNKRESDNRLPSRWKQWGSNP